VHSRKFNSGYIFSISLISALGGLLFGYDWVVIGGAKPFYEKYFQITDMPAMQGWLISCAVVGCIIGSILSGYLSDKYGRKRPLILTALVFIISAIGTGMAESISVFVIFRILGGVAIGLASNLSPIYIAEVSPESIRGKFVSLNQLTIVMGILMAQTMNWMIADPVPVDSSHEMIFDSWNGQWGWRWMFWAEIAPAVLFFTLMLLVPESPRWLAKKRKYEASQGILKKIGGADFAEKTIREIRETLFGNDPKVSFRLLLAPELRKVLIIGIVLAILQQWCGINIIFNYAEEVFAAAGYSVSDILFNIIITGSVNLIFTFVAIYTVDKIGRKMLMLIGAGSLSMIYIILGISYYFQLTGWPMLVLITSAIACYAMTFGPVVWVILAEIFPNRVRGVAMSVGTLSLWIACFLLTYTFPLLNKLLDTSGTFLLYATICLAGFIFTYKNLPETKGKSLEELEKLLVKQKQDL
jgi:MFS transporter, SP family, arabinose:H+ symporter